MTAERPATGVDLDGLYREHATRLLRLAMVMTGDRPLAEELVQEAFVGLAHARRPPTLGAELAYLRRSVVNASHSHHRHLRVVRATRQERPGTDEPAEVAAVLREAQRRVAAAVRALPDRQRDCTVLRFYEDLSDTEIAATLGISPGSVKTHLHRARAALAADLEALR